MPLIKRHARTLAGIIKDTTLETPPWTRGVITSVRGWSTINEDAWTVGVRISGSDVITANVGVLGVYVPRVGDAVWVAMFEGEPIVISKDLDGSPGNYPLTVANWHLNNANVVISGVTAGTSYYPGSPSAIVEVHASRMYQVLASVTVDNPSSTDVPLAIFIVVTYLDETNTSQTKRIGCLTRGTWIQGGGYDYEFSGVGLWTGPDFPNMSAGQECVFQLEFVVIQGAGTGGDLRVLSDVTGSEPGLSLAIVSDGGPDTSPNSTTPLGNNNAGQLLTQLPPPLSSGGIAFASFIQPDIGVAQWDNVLAEERIWNPTSPFVPFDPSLATLFGYGGQVTGFLVDCPAGAAQQVNVAGGLQGSFGPFTITAGGSHTFTVIATLIVSNAACTEIIEINWRWTFAYTGPGQVIVLDFHAAHFLGSPIIHGTDLSWDDSNNLSLEPYGVISAAGGIYALTFGIGGSW